MGLFEVSGYIPLGLCLGLLPFLGFVVNGLFIHWRGQRLKESSMQSHTARRLVYAQFFAILFMTISAFFDGMRRAFNPVSISCSILVRLFLVGFGLGKITVQLFFLLRVHSLYKDTVGFCTIKNILNVLWILTASFSIVVSIVTIADQEGGICRYTTSLVIAIIYFSLDVLTNLTLIFAFYLPIYKSRLRTPDSLTRLNDKMQTLNFHFKVCVVTVLTSGLIAAVCHVHIL